MTLQASFEFTSFLTPFEQSTLLSVPASLQNYLTTVFLYSLRSQDQKKLQQVLLILSTCKDPQTQATREVFFQRLFAGPEPSLLNALETLSKLAKDNLCDLFFAYASSDKIEYPPLEFALKALSSFAHFCRTTPNAANYLKNSPSYENGGETHLTAAKTNSYLVPLTLDPREYFANRCTETEREKLGFFYRKAVALWDNTFLNRFFSSHALLRDNPFERICAALELMISLADHPDPMLLDKDTDLLVANKIGLTQWLENLEKFVENKNPQSLPSEPDLEALLARFSGKDPQVKHPLSAEKLALLESQYIQVVAYCEKWKHLNFRQLIQKMEDRTGDSECQILQWTALFRLAAHQHFGIYLHNTQILTVLAMLLHPKGCLAQVKTGEGKSMIFALQDFILIKLGNRVLHISTTHNLAIRDHERFNPFFKLLGISTSHICVEQPEADRFQAGIIYGTDTDFQFAYMRELLYRETLFPKGVSRVAVVDEVDNLMVDNFTSSARLGIPAEETSEWVYVPIFKWVRENPGSIADLRITLSQYQKGAFAKEAAAFSNKQLLNWIQAALWAMRSQENQNYTLRQVEKKLSVVIVDVDNTGQLQQGSRWQEGLHEMVEVKHGIRTKQEGDTPIALSHASFYPIFDQVYGLTGTLGEQGEDIRLIYGIPHFDVPTFKPSRRIDHPPQLFATKKLFKKAVLELTQRVTGEGKAVLGIFKTIKDSIQIRDFLSQHHISAQLYNGIQEEEESQLLEQAGKPGTVTITTNLGARGTDIRGRLVSLTGFYPDNQRIEDQARGRAGRQGEEGESYVFICAEELSDQLPTLKNLEDQRTAKAIGERERRYQIALLERELFEVVKEFFGKFALFNDPHHQGARLTALSEALANRTCKNLTLNTQLPLKDLSIAKAAIELLTGKKPNPSLWKSLLEEVQERLNKRILHLWSVNYYHVMDKTLRNKVMQAEQGLNETEFQVLRHQIQALYIQKKQLFEKPLNTNCSGLVDYLREVTGAQLINL